MINDISVNGTANNRHYYVKNNRQTGMIRFIEMNEIAKIKI